MIGSTSSCPDTPAELFDAAGRPCLGRSVAYIGLTSGGTLPHELLAALDRSAIPYRVLPVAATDHLALYGPTAVVIGTAAIVEHLDLHSGARHTA